MTTFDCLNTDLLLEIFDYLSFTDIIYAFFDLQQRINNAIRMYPASIDLSQTIDRNALKYGPFMCRALTVWNVDSEDCLNLNFAAIRAIEFKYVHFTLLQSLFEQLPMQQLESIIIKDLGGEDYLDDIDQSIWSIIAIAGQHQLRYLYGSLRSNIWNVEQLLFDLPSLQCAIFKHISAKETLAFLSHTPNICSFTARITTWNNDSFTFDFTLSKLTHLDLYIKGCSSFEELNQLLSVCPYVTNFILRFWITENNSFMVDSTGWQTMIEQYLPRLMYLRARLFRYESAINDDDFEETFDRSEYWLNRQPQFDIRVR